MPFMAVAWWYLMVAFHTISCQLGSGLKSSRRWYSNHMMAPSNRQVRSRCTALRPHHCVLSADLQGLLQSLHPRLGLSCHVSQKQCVYHPARMQQNWPNQCVPQIYLSLLANGLLCLSSCTGSLETVADNTLQPVNPLVQMVALTDKCVVYFVRLGIWIQRQTWLHHLQMMRYHQHHPENNTVNSLAKEEYFMQHFDWPDSTPALNTTFLKPYSFSW